MFEIRLTEAAGEADGDTIFAIGTMRRVSFSPTEIIMRAIVTEGEFKGKYHYIEWSGQFSEKTGEGMLEAWRGRVDGKIIYRISFDDPIDITNLENEFGEAIFDGVDFRGNSFDNLIEGDRGNDILIGRDGDDILKGLLGNDELNGGAGEDRMFGGRGNDVYYQDVRQDRIFEGDRTGTDIVLSTSGGQLADNVENLRLMGGQALSAWGNDLANRMVGNDRANALVGQSGADRLFGEGGNDRLIGGGGGDFLKGGAGRDVLIGGAWKDRMRGDEGADRFEFRDVSDSVAGRGDIIADFEPGVDVIDLSAIDARTGPGNQAFRFIGDRAFDERPGQLRVDDGMISGDVDGDGVADFEIMVTSAVQPGEADFLL